VHVILPLYAFFWYNVWIGDDTNLDTTMTRLFSLTDPQSNALIHSPSHTQLYQARLPSGDLSSTTMFRKLSIAAMLVLACGASKYLICEHFSCEKKCIANANLIIMI
jgi:hypothetical protein